MTRIDWALFSSAVLVGAVLIDTVVRVPGFSIAAGGGLLALFGAWTHHDLTTGNSARFGKYA